MMRRPMVRRGPGLVRTMATTAVIAGTAGAVHHRQEQKYASQAAQQDAQAAATGNEAEVQELEQQVAQLQAQQAQASIAPQSTAPDLTAQLSQLAQLKQSGVLSDEEFEQAKRKLLGS
jgi:multidrug resistance efflux pump